MNVSDTLVTCFFDPPAAKPCGASEPPPRPEPTVPAARIVLRVRDLEVTLWKGTSFACGRSRACEIVVPSPSEEDAAAVRRWVRVSRRHCVFLRGPTGWLVRDGGAEEKAGAFRISSFGTWWNGSAVGDGADLTRPGLLSLGDPSPTAAFCFDVAPRAGGLCLRSNDASARHVTVLLDGAFDLGQADPGLAGLAVEGAAGGFRWCCSACTGPLLPGTVVAAQGMRIGIE